ncbi:hypothetical protein [Pseudomonas sp. SC006]|jgi:hypothetical protein
MSYVEPDEMLQVVKCFVLMLALWSGFTFFIVWVFNIKFESKKFLTFEAMTDLELEAVIVRRFQVGVERPVISQAISLA